MEGTSFSDPFKKDQKPMSQIGTGEGESPLAPRPSASPAGSMEARTFSSDLGSIKSSGGSEPSPYTPARPAGGPPPIGGAAPKIPSGIAVGGSPFPKPGGMPPSITPPPAPPIGGMKPSPLIPPAGGPTPKKGGGKKAFVAILSFLIVIALGAVGYFFVYPLFVEAPPVTTPPPAVPTLPEPEVPEAPEVPPVTGEGATSTEGEVAEPEVPPTPDPWSGIQGLSSHRSLFTIAPDATTEIILTAPTLNALNAALPSGSVATPLISEVVLKMPSGSVVPFSRLAPLLAPTFFTSGRLASFNDDATYFTYAAANGTWLGIVAPLKTGTAIGPVQDGMNALQADPDLTNFFLENPGPQGVWADGSVRDKPTSLVSFEAPAATFSYTWLDRNLLLSTNLTGAGVAATRLGF